MGRAKIAMEFIKKEKTRNATYVKRKKGLLKKSHEFSILCNVPICIIMYPYKEGKQPFEVEVYSFKGDNETASISSPIDSSRAKDPKIAREIIDRYLRVPKEERNKKAINLYDMFDEWTRKADQELCKLRQKCELVKYSSWDSANFDGFNVDQLIDVLVHLDQKIEFVKQRISMIRNDGNGNDYGHHDHNQTEVRLMPYCCFEPTPISSLMIPSDDDNVVHHHHLQQQQQKGCPEFEGVNQFPLFTYPLINNNNQEYCHQIVPFNHHHHQQQNNAFIDQFGASRMMDDHHHHIGSSSSNSSSSNLVMYNMNMNMMYDVSAMYYDQGSAIVDNIKPTSSYGDDLPMNMPLQLPVPQHNVSLPLQIRQYHQQMFYK